MYSSFEEFEKILLEYDRIPKPEKREMTFFDIMGNAHHENTCSNILSFFFDTRNNHGLEDLLIRALIKDLDFPDKKSFEETPIRVINIHREKNVDRNTETLRSGRIDILIETTSHIICIENKIYHHCEGNPFEEYQEYVKNNYKDKKHVFVLLNLGNERSKFEFQTISYNSLIMNFQGLIGTFLKKANDKYLFFLLECLYSVQKLKGNYNMTDKEMDFLIDNYQKIENLNRKIQEDLPKEIKIRLQELLGKLKFDKDFFSENDIWNNCCIYFTFKLKGLKDNFGFDILFFIDRKHWEVTLFIREQDANISQKAKERLEELRIYLRDNISVTSEQQPLGGYDRLFLLKETYGYNLSSLANRINFILKEIKEFNDNY